MKALFILGPSGSGKTTLSASLSQTYRQIFGANSVTLISLDPANYLSQFKDIEINELVTVEEVMEQYEIGPNGAILYAMDFLYQNIEWLENKIKSKISQVKSQSPNSHNLHTHLFIFDLPGQIELYINTQSVRKTIQKISSLISKEQGTSPCIVQLFDCTYMHDVNQFISMCMVSLSTMINLELPHINILNKIDVIKSSQNKPSRGLLNEYFRVSSAQELLQQLKPFDEQSKTTNADLIAKVIDTYGQVSFLPCSIYKPELMTALVYELERVFGTLELSLYEANFMEYTKEVDDFSMERAITSLENEYYQEQEEQIEKFEKDIGSKN